MKTETEACNLAKHWGFLGLGTEVDKCLVEAYNERKKKESEVKL